MDAPIGLHLEDQAIVICGSSDARIFYLEYHLSNRRKGSIKRDNLRINDRLGLTFCSHIPTAELHIHNHAEGGILTQRSDMELGIENFDVRISRDMLGQHFTRAISL